VLLLLWQPACLSGLWYTVQLTALLLLALLWWQLPTQHGNSCPTMATLQHNSPTCHGSICRTIPTVLQNTPTRHSSQHPVLGLLLLQLKFCT
jgi:hypothetical protein